MMNIMNALVKQDLLDITKVAGVNGSILGIVSWGALIDPLKVIAIIIGIIYTVFKFYRAVIEHQWNKEDRMENLND